MAFETAFNAVWVGLGAAALAVLCWSEMLRRRQSTWGARGSRALTVLFAVLFLFPCVSVSDDLLTLQGFQASLNAHDRAGQSRPHRANSDKPGLYLARFFDGLQTFQVAGLCLLSIALCFVALIFLPNSPACDRYLLSPGGRSPPLSIVF